jgi:DNA-binding MurR/RpiR family transcriptional regulator
MIETKAVISTIVERYDSLTKTQKKIADYIRNNSQLAVRMSISELSQKTGCSSESAIVRFYRALDFSSYHDFILALTSEVANRALYHTISDITAEDSIASVRDKIFDGSIKTLQIARERISEESLEQAVDAIGKAKRLFLFGYGESGYLCESLHFKLARLGFDCFYSSDSHLNAFYLSNFREGDTVIAISDSGMSKDVLVPVRASQGLATRIAITGSKEGKLAKLADICLITETEESKYRTDGIMSRIVQQAIIDVLFFSVAVKMGDSALLTLDLCKKSLSYLKRE